MNNNLNDYTSILNSKSVFYFFNYIKNRCKCSCKKHIIVLILLTLFILNAYLEK